MIGRVNIQSKKMTLTTAKLVTASFADWLNGQDRSYQWLLAHTYDGVVWGRLDNGKWQLPTEEPLNANRLLELRLFGETKECYLWRDGAQLQFRTITDGAGEQKYDYYDEQRLLWGTNGKDAGNGFTTLRDGSQGMAHTVPVSLTDSDFNENDRPAKLTVRHYIEKHKETGLAHITLSRLVSVEGNNGS